MEYETDALMDLGAAFQKFVRNQALRYAGVEVAKQTALKAFFGNTNNNDHHHPKHLILSNAEKIGLSMILCSCPSFSTR